MEKLSELEDPRQRSNGTRHDFREILVIAVCAMLSDADSFEDIALWGRLTGVRHFTPIFAPFRKVPPAPARV